MLPEDQKRILGYFIEEAKDHLNTIEQGVLNLAATIHDSEMVNEVFRAAHSVKGGAAMLGINSMQRTAHRLEDFFKVMKESPITPDQTLESMLLQIFDGLQEQLDHLQSPYGLTEDQGQSILSNLEPIFAQTETHLTSLVSGAPAPAVAAPVAAPAAPAKAVSHPETSALQLVFRSDIPELLREMLATFKQADGEESRQQLAHICQRLYSLGEQLELPQWCHLAQTVGQAVSNRDATYRSLAPVIIKDLKQAQDQVLAGQPGQVAASEALLALLPLLPPAIEDDSALDALLAEALTDSRDGEDLADLFATAEADSHGNLGLETDDSWLDQITDTDAAAFDEAGLESVFGDLNGATDLATPAESPSGFSGQHHPAIGPQVGSEELNTLADLFEGGQAGLADLWEEESSGEEENGDLDSDLSAEDIDSEFADLFQTGGTTASAPDTDDDMASLFGNALAIDIDLPADEGPEEGLALPEGIPAEVEFAPTGTDAAAPAPPTFDAELFDSADAAPAPPAPAPKAPSPEVDDFFETVAPHPQAKVIATEVDDFFADVPAMPSRPSTHATVKAPASATPQTTVAPAAPPRSKPVAPEQPVATVAEAAPSPSPSPSQEAVQATPVELPSEVAPVESELDLLFDQLDQDQDQDLAVDGEADGPDLTDSLAQAFADDAADPFALADDLELAFGDDGPSSPVSASETEVGEGTLADDLGLGFDLEPDLGADLGLDGDLALDDLSSDADLSLDLEFSLSEAATFPAADAVPEAEADEAITDPFGGLDLDSLDLLTEASDSGPELDFGVDLGAEAAVSPQVSTAPPATAAPTEEPEEDWLTELDDLVTDMPPPPGAIANGAATNGAVVTEALDLDDFSDLEALLEDEGPPPAAPPVPAPPSPPSAAIADEDNFDDLEKLLEGADQLGGSAPSVGGRRGAGVASGRAPRRTAAATDQTMRVSVNHLDNLNNLMGELVVNRNSLEQDQEQLRQSLDNLLNQVQQLNDVGQRMRDLYERSLLESSLMANRQAFALGNSGGGNSGSHATGATFDALEMDRFTGFHTLSQEMIELIVRVREASSDIEMTVDSTDQIARQFRQVTTQLQEGLNKARMVPFSQTADRLPRAVRDISIKCGKEAKLVVEGRDTLIDKMILERLYDPMTHLVNNAITHGVETPEERLAAGKAREGTITVRAFYQGNQTVIYIADNGGGINPAVVKAKALKKGLITPGEAQTMTDIEVYDLLFEPGFSTRDQADDFSGRGVGMDVVRTALADIRGSITIESEVGKGTSFTIRLPLTLSITKALSCINNQARIAFPIDGVEDMFDVPKGRVQTDDQGHTSILWRDTLLPLRPLGDLLKFNRILGRGRVYGGAHDEDMVSIVVLRSASSFIGLQVDQVIGEQEIVIKQLEGPVPKPTGIAGATVLGDGRVMPIADVLELIDMATGRVRREAPTSLWNQPEIEEPEEITIHTEPTVLIVDDSITVRELLSMSFNKVGYRVEQARDGQEAWEKLRSGLPCDLVFCDIEMPRMDGLELLSRLQKDETLSQIPIAMLTSRGADRHRQMAVELGAKGYFTKPYLEEMLLDAAQRMLKGETMISLKES